MMASGRAATPGQHGCAEKADCESLRRDGSSPLRSLPASPELMNPHAQIDDHKRDRLWHGRLGHRCCSHDLQPPVLPCIPASGRIKRLLRSLLTRPPQELYRDQLVTACALAQRWERAAGRTPSRSSVWFSQAGRVRSGSSRSSGRVIHCTGFPIFGNVDRKSRWPIAGPWPDLEQLRWAIRRAWGQVPAELATGSDGAGWHCGDARSAAS